VEIFDTKISMSFVHRSVNVTCSSLKNIGGGRVNLCSTFKDATGFLILVLVGSIVGRIVS
jgi:hypothetical protein